MISGTIHYVLIVCMVCVPIVPYGDGDGDGDGDLVGVHIVTEFIAI